MLTSSSPSSLWRRLLALAGISFLLSIPAFAQATVSTHFAYNAPTATSVSIAGEFNSWAAAPLTKGTDGNWTIDIPIAPGEYGYKFLVNGNDWEFDPSTTARKTVGGIENSSVTVGGAGAAAPGSSPAAAVPAPASTGSGGALFTYSNPSAKAVFIAGQFNGWNMTATPMTKDASGNWTAQIPLTPGNYQYKFVVDGQWTLDPANPQQADDGTGNKNSVKVVDASDTAAAGAPAASPAASGSAATTGS